MLQKLPLRKPSRERLQELGGFILVGAGVFLILANVMYTPIYRQLVAATEMHIQPAVDLAPSNLIAAQMGMMLFLPGFAAMTAGYAVIRRNMPQSAPLMMGIVIVEVVAESSLLGWILMMVQIAPPFPGWIWGLLIANWLHFVLGSIGAVLLPITLMGGCYVAKGWVRRKQKSPQVR